MGIAAVPRLYSLGSVGNTSLALLEQNISREKSWEPWFESARIQALSENKTEYLCTGITPERNEGNRIYDFTRVCEVALQFPYIFLASQELCATEYDGFPSEFSSTPIGILRCSIQYTILETVFPHKKKDSERARSNSPRKTRVNTFYAGSLISRSWPYL